MKANVTVHQNNTTSRGKLKKKMCSLAAGARHEVNMKQDSYRADY